MSRNYIGMGRYEQLFDQLDAAISWLETRCDKIERRRTNLLASKATYAQQACYDSNREIRTRPLPDPPPQPGRRYTQPTYRQPQHQKRDRYLSQPPYQPDRHRPHHLHQSHYQLPKYYQPFGGPSPAYSEFPRRQIRQSQHVPGRQPSFWDPPGARVPRNSLSYAESTSIYNPNFDCDSDGYDEGFDVGYSRQPYHQQHSVPHLRQAAACLDQPAAQQQPLLQLPPSCRHPSSGTLDEETCFMDDKIDYLSDNEKGVGHGSITATGTLPAPPHAAESQCFSHLHHDPSSPSLPVVAAVPPSILTPPSPPCCPSLSRDEGELLHDDPPLPAPILQLCNSDISEEEETLLEDKEEDDSIGEVEKIMASFNVAQITSKDVENCWFKRGGAYTGVRIIAYIHVDFFDGDVPSIVHRSTSLDVDARFIPPRNDTPYLSLLGGDKGRYSVVRYVFDPGGDVSPKRLLSTLIVSLWFPP